MTADMELSTSEQHPEQKEERQMKEEEAEGEMWTAELPGTTVELIGDDWRLRYDRSTPTRRERERVAE